MSLCKHTRKEFMNKLLFGPKILNYITLRHKTCKVPKRESENFNAVARGRFWEEKIPRKVKSPIERKLEWVPCYQTPRRTERKCPPKPNVRELQEHYIIDPEKCEPDQCKFFYPRRDLTLYQPTPKDTRSYQQTWNECVPVDMPYMPKCIYNPPKMKLRTSKIKLPEPACPQDGGAKMKNICEKTKITPMPPTGDPRCLKLTLPECCPVRKPPKCTRARSPKNCKKIRTQFPSYSECVRPDDLPRLPNECNCMALTFCEVWREYRKRKHNK